MNKGVISHAIQTDVVQGARARADISHSKRVPKAYQFATRLLVLSDRVLRGIIELMRRYHPRMYVRACPSLCTLGNKYSTYACARELWRISYSTSSLCHFMRIHYFIFCDIMQILLNSYSCNRTCIQKTRFRAKMRVNLSCFAYAHLWDSLDSNMSESVACTKGKMYLHLVAFLSPQNIYLHTEF